MAEPRLQPATDYKESPKGVISINMDQEIEDTTNDAQGVIDRNARGRVHIPKGKAFEVVVKCDGEEIAVAKGTSNPEIGKSFSLRIAVRAEKTSNVPLEPAEPEVIP